MADIELSKVLEEQKDTLKEMAQDVVAGNGAKLAGSAAALVTAAATGHPEVALLAPFAQAALAKLFGSAAERALQREIEAYAQEEEKRAFAGQIGEVVEALLGQAILQVVCVQHRLKEEELRALEEMLGGVREDLAAFREDIRAGLEQAAKAGAAAKAAVQEIVRVERMNVRDGAIGVLLGPDAAEALVRVARQVVTGGGLGVRVSPSARARVLVGQMDVSGEGSRGVEAG